MSQLEKAQKLISDVKKKVSQMEYNTVTFAGVRNISRSDLDSVEMYAEEFINSGGYSFGSFMEPRGEIKQILDKYGVIVETSTSWW